MMTDRTESATMFSVPPWEISEGGYIVPVWTRDKHRFEDRVRVANVWREKKGRTVSLDADCSSANKKENKETTSLEEEFPATCERDVARGDVTAERPFVSHTTPQLSKNSPEGSKKSPLRNVAKFKAHQRLPSSPKHGRRLTGCGTSGKVRILDLPEPPEDLRTLLDGSSPHSAEFMQRVRHYNNAFQMTSFGCGSRVVMSGYMPTFKVQGQVYHRIGSVLPPLNSDSRQLQPPSLQVFFVGYSSAEVATSHRNFPITKPHIVSILQDMLHRHNPYIHLFKDSIEKMPSPDYKLVIKADKAPPGHHPRTFNAPTINEVAIVIVQGNCDRGDIVLSKRGSGVQRINEFNRSYDALQYPLVFWNGQDGYHFHIPQLIDGVPSAHKTVSCMDFYASLLMIRSRNPGITNWLLAFGDLTHQILVDIYAKVESERLHYISAHQAQLRATEYINLLDAIRTDRSHALIGRQVIIPSSFVGSQGSMHEYAQDCMAYVHKYGRPDLFITYTCNPEWPEIKLMQFPTQGAFVRHDLVARIFQLKVTKLIDLITKEKIRPNQIDSIICAEIPKEEVDASLFRTVTKNMIHGPCGHGYPNPGCMERGRCQKKYPRLLLAETQTDRDGYPLRHPMVQHLSVHLENGQRVYFTSANAALQAHRPPKTTLTEYFALCQRDNLAKTLLYVEVPVYYIWSASKSWQPRKQGTRIADQVAFASDAIGRVYTVHPNFEECFYLRMLLHSVRGPTSFAALRTINGVLCQTYKEACLHLGLLENDQQLHHCIQEAVLSESPLKIREHFAIILTCCHPTNPQDIWTQFKEPMSADILNLARQQSNDGLLQLTYEMSPQRNVTHRTSHELLRETSYDLSRLLQFVASNEPKLANVPEQKEAYERILSKIDSNAGGLYFLDAPGGTRKTFLINLLLLTKVRSTGDIALSTASSGIAATLLHGGRTAHSTFKLPLDLTRDEVPVCNLNADSAMGEVLRQCKFIVWDECTMAHRHALEAVDITLKDCRQDQRSVRGVVLLLAGDFRQILLIIPRGTIADELHACLKAYPLWSFVERLTLSTNMRAVNSGDPNSLLFSQFLLQLGSGQLNDTDDCGPHVVEATILTGCFQNEEGFIPRIPLIHDDKHFPLHFKRLQFPIRVSFAMSINKAQGQSLKVAGIDLEQPCFSHGFDAPIDDDTTTNPLFTPQEKGHKGTRDKVSRLRWNPWQKHVRSSHLQGHLQDQPQLITRKHPVEQSIYHPTPARSALPVNCPINTISTEIVHSTNMKKNCQLIPIQNL
ncbi:hypothetical protein LAZ67_5001306 [Cordylochernes scorpioides]|uniref:ATP-dependent DNA helicase n=1 Tax=Cordylochernes scorpioides TaxID=51811 RepID=A0ABY6KFH0_9ARAC|nr:hypothetical protein LAZ67_5001306 [Cordylochernes scorpioides]